MPLIEVTLTQGRTPEQIRSMISALTHAVADSIDAPIPSIRVVVREVPTTHFAAGDVTLAERHAAPPKE
ncbi:4-oxalocrotonate tautomerase family protein [Janibacter sp. GXQ6167]|uniref:tautomerase family protein n=1 Tax=Janibacter sp. GXQ6167 TaxID=3240791 RepID=UPI003526A6EA